MDTGLNTIEFYSGDISGDFANSPTPQANGGAQDNGSSSVMFSGTPPVPRSGRWAKAATVSTAALIPLAGIKSAFWQGNNSGHVHRCISACTASGASWSDYTGGWLGDTEIVHLPYEIFKGDSSWSPDGGRSFSAAATSIVGSRVWNDSRRRLWRQRGIALKDFIRQMNDFVSPNQPPV